MVGKKIINGGRRPRKSDILNTDLTTLADDTEILIIIKLIGRRYRKIS